MTLPSSHYRSSDLLPRRSDGYSSCQILKLAGVRDLTDQFDGFIVDLWGVVHDGCRLFHGVKDALGQLRALNRKVIFVTNSSRRIDALSSMLEDFGINQTYYHSIMSSGEAAFAALSDPDNALLRQLGCRCFPIGEQEDGKWVEALKFELVGDINNADFILAFGLLPDNKTVNDYIPLLDRAKKRKLTLVCANPDRNVEIAGSRRLAAGAIADAYVDFGGPTVRFGKPDPAIYEACFSTLSNVPRNRIVAIGDSLATDIAGAARLGLFTVLVTGIGALYSANPGDPADEIQLCRLVTGYGAQPNATMPAFIW